MLGGNLKQQIDNLHNIRIHHSTTLKAGSGGNGIRFFFFDSGIHKLSYRFLSNKLHYEHLIRFGTNQKLRCHDLGQAFREVVKK